MSSVRRAVIDVGTNSVKVLVADVSGHDVRPVFEDSKQTRLGQGFYENHRLQPEAIARTSAAIGRFTGIARSHDAASIRIIATSAARDAVNAAELIEALERASALKVEIISGDQEAEWAFQGVTSDPRLANEPLLLLDTGGGSTEFILGQGEHKRFARSFPLGTVRLMEKIPHGNPPLKQELAACRRWVREFLSTEVRPRLEPAVLREMQENPSRPLLLVGTGGTTSILARIEAGLPEFDRERIEATRLNLDRVRHHVEHLWSLPLSGRQEIVGLPPKRADVILTGVVIFEAIMEQFSFRELQVSTRGLRFAAVMS